MKRTYNGKLVLAATLALAVIVSLSSQSSSTTVQGAAAIHGVRSSSLSANAFDTAVPTSVIVYRTKPRWLDSESVVEFAASAFGLAGPVQDDGESFRVVDGSRILMVVKASGAALFFDDDKLWNPAYRPLLPTFAEARAAAIAFLDQNGLLPAEAEAAGVVKLTATDETGEEIDNHWLVDFNFRMLAGTVEGQPVLLPVKGSAGIEARVGENGEIIGLFYNWRPVEPFDQFPTLNPSSVVEFAVAKGLGEQLRAERLAYFEEGQTEVQNYVQPVYIIDSPAGDVDFIAATEFTPIVNITEPEVNEFPDGQVSLSGGVLFGGKAPFRFLWRSSLSGPIGDAPKLERSLDPGTHTIFLEGIDARGQIDIDRIVVQVGGASAVSLIGSTQELAPNEMVDLTKKPEPTGWSFKAEIDPDRGLKITDVQLNKHKVAKTILVPTYAIETTRLGGTTCLLRAAQVGLTCASSLKGGRWEFRRRSDGAIVVSAQYEVTGLPADSDAKLEISQTYAFWKATRTCEPSARQCHLIKPTFWHKFTEGSDGTKINRIEIRHRIDLEVDGDKNSGAFAKDNDNIFVGVPGIGINLIEPGNSDGEFDDRRRCRPDSDQLHFFRCIKPIGNEIVRAGGSGVGAPVRDNFHAVPGDSRVTVVGCKAGKWNCLHTHTRWGLTLKTKGNRWNNNEVYDSDALVTMFVVVDRAGELGDPVGYLGTEGTENKDLVFWYVAERRDQNFGMYFQQGLFLIDCNECPVSVERAVGGPLGGSGFFPEVGASSGPSAGVLAGIASAVLAGAITLGGGAWYARRRWLRR